MSPAEAAAPFFYQVLAKSCWNHLTPDAQNDCCLVAKACPTLLQPHVPACQVPLSMGFLRQEYWSGLPFPSPSDLPDSAIEPFFTAEPQGKPNFLINKL